MFKPVAQNPSQGDIKLAKALVDRHPAALGRPKSDVQFKPASILKHGHTPRVLQGKKSSQERKP